MHRTQRPDDVRDLRREDVCGAVEGTPEGGVGEQAEQDLHALVVDEGAGQHL